MKLETAAVASIVMPSIGPAIITLFGVDVPVLAMALALAGLLLARSIAPPPLRKLSQRQEIALTLLLIIILFLIVTGSISGGKPVGAGMAVVWGIGLGSSGLLAVEFFSERVMGMLRALLGKSDG